MDTAVHSFDLSRFFARYLCGGEALKGFRTVSRAQLALAKCDVGYFEPRAINLALAIDRFMDCVNLLVKKKINKTLICKVNCLLRNVEVTENYRTMDVWIGRSREKAKHIPPSHMQLDSLMSNWLSRANEENLSTKDVFEIYAQYLLIHPFPDGNGRTGRAIVMALLKTCQNSCLPPDLYRLKKGETHSFVDQVQSFVVDTQNAAFIDGWLSWESKCRIKIEAQLKRTVSLLECNYVVSPINEMQEKVLHLLWEQAVISKPYLKKKLNASDKEINEVLAFLVRIKILEEKRVKFNPSMPIYQAPIILEFLQNLDDLIFLT